MSLFQFICADYFSDELPLPVPAVKIIKQNKNENEKKMDSTDTAAKIIKKDDSSRNRALTFTTAFDGLFQFEITQQKKEKKNADSTDTASAKTLNFCAATDNVVVGESKKNNSKNKALAYAPAFDGLFPFEMFVSR